MPGAVNTLKAAAAPADEHTGLLLARRRAAVSGTAAVIHEDAPAESDDEHENDGSDREHNDDDNGEFSEFWDSGANVTYNSLDFDDVENDLLVESRQRDPAANEPSAIKQWIIIVVIGVLTALVAFGIDQGIKYLMQVKFEAVTHFMTTHTSAVTTTTTATTSPPKVEAADVMGVDASTTPTTTTTMSPNSTTTTEYHTSDIPFAAPFFIFILINAAYVSVAAALVIFGEPVARGSGIGEIKCYLNGIRIFRVVRMKTLLCKAVGILFSVASGLPCGKEGPMIHSGAAIASGVATGKSTKLHCDTGIFREFRNDKHKRVFVTAGAAAGVGAAFGAPVGGLLFAVEEVGSFWNLDLTVKVFVCSAVTPWVLQLLLNPREYENASIRGLIDFGRVDGEYNYNEIPFVILLGVFGGLIGAAFIGSNIVLTKWRKKYVTTKAARFAEVLIVNALTSAVLITLVLRGFSCLGEANVQETNRIDLKRYGCGPGQYNDMATYFFRSMEESIGVLIHTEATIPAKTLVMQMIPYFALTVLTYGIYVPSGLFLPTLALGASFGHLYAQTWNSITGDTPHLDPARFALYGGTAVLGGVVRMTISVIVIVMEATGNTSIFYPLVMITVAAKLVGDKFTHGVYDAHIHLNAVPLLESKLENPTYAKLSAKQVMHQNIVVVPRLVTVAHLKKVLRATPFDNALVVVDPEKNGKFVGLLLRRSATILIVKGAYNRRLVLADFVKSDKERQLFRVKKYGILEPDAEDVHRCIDLSSYMDRWPYTVQETTPLPRVFRTFRELGLRHIVVLDEDRKPVGLIGRKQLTHLHPATQPTALDLQQQQPGSGGGRIGSDSPSVLSPNKSSPLFSSNRFGGAGGAVGTTPAAGGGIHGLSPSTSVRRVLTADELMSSLRTRIEAHNDDNGDTEWRDPHIQNVT